MDKEQEYRENAPMTEGGAPAARQETPDRPQGTPAPQPQNQQGQWQQGQHPQWQQPGQPAQYQPQPGQPQYAQPQYGQPQGYQTATQPTAAAVQNGGTQRAIAVKKENRRPASARDLVYAVIAAVSCILTADFIF
ncbi:MAG: hypothetical protein ACI4SJ_05200, partial [Candidatus Avispirillum sp.]